MLMHKIVKGTKYNTKLPYRPTYTLLV